MVGLALHTSSPALGLAIGDDVSTFDVDMRDRHLRTQVWALGRSLSTDLHPYLIKFLPPQTWSDLTFIAVAQGPGGFTGTRIGVVAARTLAQQLQVPLFGISSLAAIAQYHLDQANLTADQPIAVQMRAQRGEVYGAIYQPNATGVTPLLGDAVFRADDWQTQLTNWPQPCQLWVAEDDLAYSVTAVLALAWARWQQRDRPEWSTTLPFYGQHPVA